MLGAVLVFSRKTESVLWGRGRERGEEREGENERKRGGVYF